MTRVFTLGLACALLASAGCCHGSRSTYAARPVVAAPACPTPCPTPGVVAPAAVAVPTGAVPPAVAVPPPPAYPRY